MNQRLEEGLLPTAELGGFAPPREEEGSCAREREALGVLFRTIEKALGSFQLYPPEHKIRLQFVQDLQRRIRSFLERHGDLDLEVLEDRFLYGEHTVYREPNLARSLPFKLYRDGIRKLIVYQGVEDEEINDLIEVLAAQPAQDDAEDDMVTLLWEKDFSHVAYFMFDELDGEDQPDALDMTKHLKRGDEAVHLGAAESAPAPDAKYLAPKLSISALSNVLTVTDHDLGTVRAMVARENSRNLRHDLTTLLFEMLAIRKDEVRSFSDSMRILGLLIESYVQAGDLTEAAEVVRKFRALLDEDLTPSHHEIVRGRLADAASGETMRLVAEILDRPVVENSRDLVTFLRLLGPDVLDGLIDILPRIRNRHVLTDLLAELAVEGRERLLAELHNDDPSVVQQVIRVLTQTGDPAVAPRLRAMVHHQSLAVRLEALRALASMGGPDARAAILAAARDPEHQVRILALRSIKGERDASILDHLVRMLDEKTADARDRFETQELFSAIARVGGAEAVPVVRRVLEKRTLFGRARNRVRQTCAALALGWLDLPESRDLLERYSRSGCDEVREACRLALRRLDRGEDPPEEES